MFREGVLLINSLKSFLFIAQIRAGSTVIAKSVLSFSSRKAISPKISPGLIRVKIFSFPSEEYLTIFTLPVFKKKMDVEGSLAK